MRNQKFKIGDTLNWSGNFFKDFKEGWDMDKAIEHLTNNGNRLDFAIDEFKSGTNKIVNITYEFNTYFYELDNEVVVTDNKNVSLAFKKPKFYQTALAEIKGNVLDEVYPHLKGKEQLTMTERMGSEEAKCPECSNNEWWLLPADSVAVREGGKPYIECLHCGLQTHL